MKKNELLKASDHLWYEFWMVDELFKKISTIPSSWNLNLIEHNAFLESFILHSRNLIDFMYSEKSYKDDLLAIDYVSNWEEIKPNLPEILNEVKKRANKEIGHLTTKRVGLSLEQKAWNYVKINQKIKEVFYKFLTLCQDEYLNSNLIKVKKSLIN